MARFSHHSFTASPQSYAKLTPTPDGLAFTSSYDAGLVAEFKQLIPTEGRKWDPAHKRWLVDPQYAGVCAQLTSKYLGIDLAVPKLAAVAQTETRLVKLEYLGACKERENGEASAFGWADGGWTVIVPEQVLREWFEAVPSRPGEKPTLYTVLTVKPSASTDEIRSAYRRLARQWHPDLCSESDAAEQFKIIQHAYEVLSNEALRRKYAAGLALQASTGSTTSQPSYIQAAREYRAPLRCGWVLAEGKQSLGRFVVGGIIQWEDVVDDLGQVMVASWPMGSTAPEVAWR